MNARHDGFDEAYEGGLEPFKAWLQEEFENEEDAVELFWLGIPQSQRFPARGIGDITTLMEWM